MKKLFAVVAKMLIYDFCRTRKMTTVRYVLKLVDFSQNMCKRVTYALVRSKEKTPRVVRLEFIVSIGNHS